MKIYIAGKVSGLDYNKALEKFEKAEKEVQKLIPGSDPVNPCKVCPYKEFFKWENYMDFLLPTLLRCDAIYLLRDWGLSKGARVERAVAQEIGITIIYQDEVQF